MIATLPNNTSGMRLFMAHTLAIPPCCPVSRNPLAGSTFTICYRARVDVLEIYSLKAYIRDFIGGYRGVTGEIEIRTMEGMIARVAADCASAVGVPVRVKAEVLLRPQQSMTVIARCYPERETVYTPDVKPCVTASPSD